VATRLYLSTGLAPISPAADASWEKATGFRRGQANTEQSGTTLLEHGQTAQGTIGNDTLWGMFLSAPLDSNQTITGNVKGQVIAREAATSNDSRMQCLIRVLSNDGTTVRGTLLAHDTGALASEFATGTNTNRKVPRGGSTALGSVNALTGDRISIEIGYRQHATQTANHIAVFGDPADGTADLPENETATSGVPWVEFDQTITFASTVPTRFTQEVAEVPFTPDVIPMRVTQVVLEVVQGPGVRTPRTQVIWID
jgi:hypothetical protein